VEDDIHQRAIDFKIIQGAVVFDEAQFTEFVHENKAESMHAP
jgi:hypothetical protein